MKTTGALEPKIIGSVEIRDKDGALLVAFSTENIDGFWSQVYEAERIRYCMRNRRKKIAISLREGRRPLNLKRETLKLWLKNILRR